MPRAGLSTGAVVNSGLEIADEGGLDNLTLAAIAARHGVALPSLYKHVAGLPALRRLIAVRAKQELTAVLTAAIAGQARGEALRSLASAYLDWARRHPGRYAATIAAGDPGNPADEVASAEAVAVVQAALSGYALDEDTTIDAIRTVRALIDGYLALERAGGFGLSRSPADSLEWAVAAVEAQLETAGR